MALDELINGAIKVSGRRTIVFWPNFFGLDWLRKVRFDDVLPVCQKRALEDVFELEETLLVREINFCRSSNEVGNGPRDSKFGAKLPAVRVDLGGLFLIVLIATQLVGLWEFRFLVPGSFTLKKGVFSKILAILSSRFGLFQR